MVEQMSLWYNVEYFDVSSAGVWQAIDLLMNKVSVNVCHEWRSKHTLSLRSSPVSTVTFVSDLSQADMCKMKSRNHFDLHFSVEF